VINAGICAKAAKPVQMHTTLPAKHIIFCNSGSIGMRLNMLISVPPHFLQGKPQPRTRFLAMNSFAKAI
jgi:hypothetical protein